MRGLKILVVGLGVMIVVTFAVLVAVIAGRLSRGGANSVARSFAPATLDLPRGARIETMAAGADRLVLELALPEGGRQLVIVDMATGARLGVIDLRAAP